MKTPIAIVLLALGVAGCVTSPTPNSKLEAQRTATDHGIQNSKEFKGQVENWGNAASSPSSLSVWIQQISYTNYALFQLRANLDTYRFALSHDQVVSFIDALDNYQMTARQSSNEQTPAVGWLYRANVKMKRVGEDAKDDRLIVNIERRPSSAPALSITFDSWLLSFSGPSSAAERAYKGLVLTSDEALRLRAVLNEFSQHL